MQWYSYTSVSCVNPQTFMLHFIQLWTLLHTIAPTITYLFSTSCVLRAYVNHLSKLSHLWSLTNGHDNVLQTRSHTYLQQMVKQYWMVQRPVKLSFSPRFMLGLHWPVTFRISIRASINSGYFSLSGVPRMKLQA